MLGTYSSYIDYDVTKLLSAHIDWSILKKAALETE